MYWIGRARWVLPQVKHAGPWSPQPAARLRRAPGRACKQRQQGWSPPPRRARSQPRGAAAGRRGFRRWPPCRLLLRPPPIFCSCELSDVAPHPTPPPKLPACICTNPKADAAATAPHIPAVLPPQAAPPAAGMVPETRNAPAPPPHPFVEPVAPARGCPLLPPSQLRPRAPSRHCRLTKDTGRTHTPDATPAVAGGALTRPLLPPCRPARRRACGGVCVLLGSPSQPP
jgi:hypothetical protein